MALLVISFCNSQVSRGSDIPHKMNTENMKTHLKKYHPEIDLSVSAQDAPSSSKAAKKGSKGYISIFRLRTKEERQSMLEITIPDFLASRSMLPFHSPKAQRIHKSIFERMMVDLIPFNEVNKPGFIRHHYLLEPRFEIASDKYYKSLLDPTYERIREKLCIFLQ